MLLISILLFSARLIVEEKLFKEYSLNVLYVIGYEGLWGIFITFIAVISGRYIDCGKLLRECPGNKLEDSIAYFDQVFVLSAEN